MAFRQTQVYVNVTDALTQHSVSDWLGIMQEYDYEFYPAYYGYGYILHDPTSCYARYWLDVLTPFHSDTSPEAKMWMNMYSVHKSLHHIQLAKVAVRECFKTDKQGEIQVPETNSILQ